MPDMKYTLSDSNGVRVLDVPDFNDSSIGIYCLAQTIINMLFHPSYGNLYARLRRRISVEDVGPIVIEAVDRVEHVMLEEQSHLSLPDEEMLSSIKPMSVTLSNSNTQLSIRLLVHNILDQTTALEV